MVSFDVTALYTNVPIKDTLLIIKDLLENDSNLHTKTKLPLTELLEITEFLLTKTWFLFNGRFLRQTDGVAMGGPTSSVVAEIYMQAHESTALTCTSHPPKVWKRYVDDVFSIIKRSFLRSFYDHLNSLHTKIKFTIEEENDNCIAFLDTSVKRHEDQSLSVLVYRKPTHTEQYLNFHSNHETRVKESVICSLFLRAKNTISDAIELKKENDRITNVLICNDYPHSMIKRTKHKLERKPLHSDQVATAFKAQINLPYIPKISEHLRRIFRDHKIQSTFYASNTLRKVLSHPKDCVPPEMKNELVYRIPCKDCNQVYIGETKRTLSQRKNIYVL